MLNNKPYPYPKKAIVKFEDAYLDGGTRCYKVINFDEIGIKHLYQDFRLNTPPDAEGKWYTSYPGNGAIEVVSSFVLTHDGDVV